MWQVVFIWGHCGIFGPIPLTFNDSENVNKCTHFICTFIACLQNTLLQTSVIKKGEVKFRYYSLQQGHIKT